MVVSTGALQVAQYKAANRMPVQDVHTNENHSEKQNARETKQGNVPKSSSTEVILGWTMMAKVANSIKRRTHDKNSPRKGRTKASQKAFSELIEETCGEKDGKERRTKLPIEQHEPDVNLGELKAGAITRG